MASALKACKACRAIYTGAQCPSCGANAEESSDAFKGKVVILDAEQSEIAKNFHINKKGTYAVKIG